MKVLFGLLLLSACRSTKQEVRAASHFPVREDGFYYYAKNKGYAADEYLLLKFYRKGHMAELAPSTGMNGLNADSQGFACLLDKLSKTAAIFYRVKGDSVFFKKRAWESHEFSSLYFACKAYNDSIVARITPVDYTDTLTTPLNKPPKPYTTIYRFKQALCDTSLFTKSPATN